MKNLKATSSPCKLKILTTKQIIICLVLVCATLLLNNSTLVEAGKKKKLLGALLLGAALGGKGGKILPLPLPLPVCVKSSWFVKFNSLTIFFSFSKNFNSNLYYIQQKLPIAIKTEQKIPYPEPYPVPVEKVISIPKPYPV